MSAFPDLAGQRPTTERLEPGISHIEYPHVARRGPTYRENSHAHHTWRPSSHQTPCFQAPQAPPVWVRFPSPAPIIDPWSSREIQGRSQAVDSKVFHPFGSSSDFH